MSDDSIDAIAGDSRRERASILRDISIAEAQIACGEGVEHDVAKAQVLTRILKSRPVPNPQNG